MLSIDLKGKNALVTGGSRGVGASICKTLAKAGANVIINYASSEDRALEVLKEVEGYGVKGYIFKCDMSNPLEVEKMMEFAKEKFSSLEILVNNAGTTFMKKIEEITLEDWDKIHNLNLNGVFYSCKYALPLLKARSEEMGSSIINIGSTSMYTGAGGGGHYASTKAALLGYTRALAKELGPHKITANLLAISLIQTDMMDITTPDDVKEEKRRGVPVGRLGRVEDVAYLSAFLGSDMGSYISGEVISVDGARTFA